MLYDPANPIVQLCVKGIETEYSGDLEKAGCRGKSALEFIGPGTGQACQRPGSEGYGNMIRKGISAGLARMEKYSYDYPDKKSV